jgi:hypothetical protein
VAALVLGSPAAAQTGGAVVPGGLVIVAGKRPTPPRPAGTPGRATNVVCTWYEDVNGSPGAAAPRDRRQPGTLYWRICRTGARIVSRTRRLPAGPVLQMQAAAFGRPTPRIEPAPNVGAVVGTTVRLNAELPPAEASAVIDLTGVAVLGRARLEPRVSWRIERLGADGQPVATACVVDDCPGAPIVLDGTPISASVRFERPGGYRITAVLHWNVDIISAIGGLVQVTQQQTTTEASVDTRALELDTVVVSSD